MVTGYSQLQKVHHGKWQSYNLESRKVKKTKFVYYLFTLKINFLSDFLILREAIEAKLNQCIKLNKNYREAYLKV